MIEVSRFELNHMIRRDDVAPVINEPNTYVRIRFDKNRPEDQIGTYYLLTHRHVDLTPCNN